MTGLGLAAVVGRAHVGEGHPLLGLVLAAIGVSELLAHGLDQLPATLTAAAALIGAVVALLPALSAYRDRHQARRHAEERHRDRRQPR